MALNNKTPTMPKLSAKGEGFKVSLTKNPSGSKILNLRARKHVGTVTDPTKLKAKNK